MNKRGGEGAVEYSAAAEQEKPQYLEVKERQDDRFKGEACIYIKELA